VERVLDPPSDPRPARRFALRSGRQIAAMSKQRHRIEILGTQKAQNQRKKHKEKS
jgi:hypothetical protein